MSFRIVKTCFLGYVSTYNKTQRQLYIVLQSISNRASLPFETNICCMIFLSHSFHYAPHLKVTLYLSDRFWNESFYSGNTEHAFRFIFWENLFLFFSFTNAVFIARMHQKTIFLYFFFHNIHHKAWFHLKWKQANAYYWNVF